MKKTYLLAVLAGGLFLTYSCEEKSNDQKGETVEAAEERNDSTLRSDDKKEDAEFLVKAANGGLLEVEAGKLAQQQAVSKDIKSYAKHIIEDHSKANEELKSYASRKNISLPASLDKDSQEKIDKLKEKKGKEFDQEYIDFMVKDHKEDINDFEDASKDAKDPELKAWVDKTLPTLRHHLELAEQKDSLLEVRSSKNASERN
jgi:putative membrane protein